MTPFVFDTGALSLFYANDQRLKPYVDKIARDRIPSASLFGNSRRILLQDMSESRPGGGDTLVHGAQREDASCRDHPRIILSRRSTEVQEQQALAG